MIEVRNLTKKFGPHIAVNNISFTVNDGEVVGFLGPNGAGKTTTMNMMTGYISSTSGTVRINGFDILDEPEKAKKKLGYLPDVPPIYPEMTVNEYLSFVCDLKGVKKADKGAMIEKIVKRVGLENMEKRLVGNLSKGYRQRVGLAQALVGEPEVLILDEPTVGLDPKQIIEMRELIKELGKTHTVILSSHILSEVSAICDRVIIINKGNIVAEDTTENINSGKVSHIQLATIKGDPQKAIEGLLSIDVIKNVEIIGQDENIYDLKITGEKDRDIREVIFAVLAMNRASVLMLKPYSLSLEEVFMRVISEDYRPEVVNEEGGEVNDSNI